MTLIFILVCLNDTVMPHRNYTTVLIITMLKLTEFYLSGAGI